MDENDELEDELPGPVQGKPDEAFLKSYPWRRPQDRSEWRLQFWSEIWPENWDDPQIWARHSSGMIVCFYVLATRPPLVIRTSNHRINAATKKRLIAEAHYILLSHILGKDF